MGMKEFLISLKELGGILIPIAIVTVVFALAGCTSTPVDSLCVATSAHYVEQPKELIDGFPELSSWLAAHNATWEKLCSVP